MPEQIRQGREEGSDVGPACGFEDFFHAIGFFLSADDAHAGEHLTRPVRGIELDRKVLADIAVKDVEGFKALVAQASKHASAVQPAAR